MRNFVPQHGVYTMRAGVKNYTMDQYFNPEKLKELQMLPDSTNPKEKQKTSGSGLQKRKNESESSRPAKRPIIFSPNR